MVVVDPPFITEAVWELYATTSRSLLKSGLNEDGSPKGKVILTTLFENAEFLNRMLGAKPTVRILHPLPQLRYSYFVIATICICLYLYLYICLYTYTFVREIFVYRCIYPYICACDESGYQLLL